MYFSDEIYDNNFCLKKFQKNKKLPKSTKSTKPYERGINRERLMGTHKEQQHLMVDQQTSVGKVGENDFCAEKTS